ncbi:alpha-amylase family glycosyl hydrolase [Vallitalea okinawensis]|uniref:alpha-amylase family glycosyl hydrolase n=1 Tax=Vallitalea okinawensis TaxID=2078660 RepID=UPI000CFCD302|nr:alpha-amylase family glycosyl hydrolase [Vallitalea okinawensis]
MKKSRKVVSLLCGLLMISSIIFGYTHNNQVVSAATASGQSIGTITANDSIYQIMVDRFYDGDLSNNGDPGTMRYSENSEDDFRYMHGGDWQGIIDKMDYIKDMGYTAIWISPVTEPQLWNIGGYPSAYHGYNMYDPNKANQYFGVKGDYQASLDKLKELVDTAHANGIKVIIDVVPNHVGDYLEGSKDYYDQGQEPAAPYNNSSWYHHNGDIDWSNEHPHTDANIQMLEDHDLGGLDDIDFDNTEAKNAVFNSIKSFFDYTGADGARVDAAKCMHPSDVGALEDYLGVNTYGECFDMHVNFVARWVGDNAEWGMLDFPLYQSIVNGFAYGQSFDDTSYEALSLKNTFSQDSYYNGQENNMVTFIDNHDKNRFLTEAGGNVDKLQNAITFIYAARGVPVIFQGTEQNRGNINNTYINGIADTWNRWSMFTKDSNGNITGDDFNTNTDTYQLITSLNNLRNEYEALRTGKQREMWASSNLYAFSRRVESGANEGQEVVAVFSNATNSQTETISIRTESTVEVGAQFVNALDSSDIITVTSGGVTGKQITVSVGANRSKIYVPHEGGGQGNIPVTFTINNAYTFFGQNVYITGNCDELSNWDTSTAIGPASCPDYPTWTLTINLPAGQEIEYKAIKKDGSGNVEWQSGNNRTYTVPTSGTGAITMEW